MGKLTDDELSDLANTLDQAAAVVENARTDPDADLLRETLRTVTVVVAGARGRLSELEDVNMPEGDHLERWQEHLEAEEAEN